MTDRELLELIAQKVNSTDQKMTSMNHELRDIRQDIGLIKTQQSEHGEILQALRHSSEAHKAELDNLKVEMARLSGKVEGLSTDINYLVRKSVQNADDIRELRMAK